MMGEGTVNDEELVEVMAQAWCEANSHTFDDCTFDDQHREHAAVVLAALRSAGFQVFKPEDCEQGRVLSSDWTPFASVPSGTYFLVPADSGGSG